jgi:hypothetical protein
MRSFLARHIPDGNRCVQRKIETGFGRDFHSLALGHRLNRGSTPSPHAGSNRRAFSASSQAADQSAKSGAAADDGRRTLTARSAFLLNVACGECVGPFLIRKAFERNCKFAAPLEFSSGAGIDEFQRYVEAPGDDDLVAHDDGRIERAAKRSTGGACGRVDRINGADGDDGAFGNSDRNGMRRGWRGRSNRRWRNGWRAWERRLGRNPRPGGRERAEVVPPQTLSATRVSRAAAWALPEETEVLERRRPREERAVSTAQSMWNR